MRDETAMAPANRERLEQMGWPMAETDAEFLAGMSQANEVTLRKALHRLKLDERVYGVGAQRIALLSAELNQRVRQMLACMEE